MAFFLTTLAYGKDDAAAADDSPFWTGRPDAATFQKVTEGRIARARAAIDRMLKVQGKRTVQNTLAPYDEALMQLDAAGSQTSLIENVHPDSALRTAAEGMSQHVAAYANELSLDRRVYDALSALDLAGADATTRYYVQKELRDFKLAGVDRDEATREQVKALREELVKVGQDFSRNIRSDLRKVEVADARELDGLPADFIERHKPDAGGKITITIDYPDAIPVFSYARNDDLRRRLYMEYSNRGYPRNMAVLDSLIAKRHRLAQLLGFANWADYITANKMVGSGKNAGDFIQKIADASAQRAVHEADVLLRRKQQEAPGAAQVNAWEALYWAEQVRKSEFDFDAQTVRPYLPYESVKQGVLDLTSRLFGVTFRRVPDAPVWHPSVECWEMLEDGKRVGRFYLDMHPRPDKYNHAAEFDVRTGVAGKQIPEAALICNLPGGEPGDPGLMEHADLVTFLHEFGHLLHTLFAGRQPWCGIGGIRTEQDFVEAPSQMLEEWAWDPAVLAGFARHYQTHEPIPADLVRQMKRAHEFGKGLQVRRQMMYAELSLSCYDRDPAAADHDAMAKRLTAKYLPSPYVEGTHYQCAFGHLDGYSAVYYTYMWSLVIAKDLFSQFDRANLLAPATARRYRDAVLAPGGSLPADQLVRNFLGRPFSFESWQRWLEEGS